MSGDKNKNRTLRVGSLNWEIIGPTPETIFVDGISELRVIDGIAYVSLCQHSVDGDNPGQVQVSARLRLPISAAQMIASNLLGAIEDATKRTGEAKTKAN